MKINPTKTKLINELQKELQKVDRNFPALAAPIESPHYPLSERAVERTVICTSHPPIENVQAEARRIQIKKHLREHGEKDAKDQETLIESKAEGTSFAAAKKNVRSAKPREKGKLRLDIEALLMDKPKWRPTKRRIEALADKQKKTLSRIEDEKTGRSEFDKFSANVCQTYYRVKNALAKKPA